MAGSVPEIRTGDITGVKGNEKRPVFMVKLKGKPTPDLVVKGDGFDYARTGDTAISIKWSSKLMKHVDNEAVNTKIMIQSEIAELTRAVLATYTDKSSPQYGYVAPEVGYECTWVKMPFVPGLSDADFRDADDERIMIPDKVKYAIEKLHDPIVWTGLGKVVAVDIFNGNNDRFDSETGEWANYGNIMFLPAGGVIGLDTFDPRSNNSNLNKQGSFAELLILKDKGRRDKFVTDCLTSVGTTLQQALVNLSLKQVKLECDVPGKGRKRFAIKTDDLQTYFLQWSDEFNTGLEQGTFALKSNLDRKVGEYYNAYKLWEQCEQTRLDERINHEALHFKRMQTPLQRGRPLSASSRVASAAISSTSSSSSATAAAAAAASSSSSSSSASSSSSSSSSSAAASSAAAAAAAAADQGITVPDSPAEAAASYRSSKLGALQSRQFHRAHIPTIYRFPNYPGKKVPDGIMDRMEFLEWPACIYRIP